MIIFLAEEMACVKQFVKINCVSQGKLNINEDKLMVQCLLSAHLNIIWSQSKYKLQNTNEQEEIFVGRLFKYQVLEVDIV